MDQSLEFARLESKVMKIYRLLICALLVVLAAFLLAAASGKNLAARPTTNISLFRSLQTQTKPQPTPAPTPATQSATKSSLLISSFFRISQSASASANRRASSPAVAYNVDDNEYLAVWESDVFSEVQGVSDVYGQRINGATNERIGVNFRISNLTEGDRRHNANDPKVVYNRAAREYLVVWHGSGLVHAPDRFFEIYGQRISRTGSEIGKDFRISHTTELGKINTNVVRSNGQADVAWNSVNNEYLVIWKGMAEPEDFVKMEIYGQRVKANGELAGKHFRISHTTNQGSNFHADAPAIAYNSQGNQYFVVWTGGYKKEAQTEVWGNLVSGGAGAPGGEDLRISDLSSTNQCATSPQVSYNIAANQYLVVFQANPLASDATPFVNNILGQRIDAGKPVEIQTKYLRISNNTGVESLVGVPRVTYNPLNKEYLVLWPSTLANAPTEISGQRLSSSGSEIEADFQISNIVSVGKDRSINDAGLAHNSTNGRYLVVWEGNALPEAASSKLYEIFGQQLSHPR